MENAVLLQLKDLGLGAVLAFAAIGSALGAGTAGMAAVGSWKKCLAQGKAAPFQLLIFVGAPLSQTFYGMIMMIVLNGAIEKGVYLWSSGIFGGIAMGMSAWMQGKAGAAASDALAETGKGMGQYIAVIGIIESVALFVMAFLYVFTQPIVG